MATMKLRKWIQMCGILEIMIHHKGPDHRFKLFSSAKNASNIPSTILACLNPIPICMLSAIPERRKYPCILHRYTPLIEAKFQIVATENG